MKMYLIRTEGATVTLSSQEVSPTDNIAMPVNSSALSEGGWGVVEILCGAAGLTSEQRIAAVVERLSAACSSAGLTLDNQLPNGATE